jgi:polar amino acid transport system substrate-binding protein
MKGKRRVAAHTGDGHICLLEEDIPPVGPGAVLVEVHASLVSPGTELNGWRALSDRRKNPDPNAEPRKFGYANSGVVIEAGDGVTDLKPGDRVACMGAGFALHTDYAVVPHNLCAPLPPAVTFAQGSFTHLAATALQALRRGQPEVGEFVAVVGLGLVGQLASRLYQLAGCYVIGWDTIPFRTEVAGRLGVDTAVLVGREDEIARTRAFTDGLGLDAAVIAFGGNADKAMQSLEACMKCSPDGHLMGRIVVVGGAQFTYKSTTTNLDIRRSSRTGAGYHDSGWEYGPDYPAVFMRWTTRSNLKLCIRLIAEGKLDVNKLTTHKIPLQNVEKEIDSLLKDPDSVLGVVFEM